MTGSCADNPKVFRRWQPRMLAPEEAPAALSSLLGRPREELAERFVQLEVSADPEGGERAIRASWAEVRLDPTITRPDWSEEAALRFV